MSEWPCRKRGGTNNENAKQELTQALHDISRHLKIQPQENVVSRRPRSRHSRTFYAIRIPIFLRRLPKPNMQIRICEARSDETQAIDGICRKFAMKHSVIHEFCTAKSARSKIFCAARSSGCRCPGCYAQIREGHARPDFGPYDFRVSLCQVNKGGTSRGPYLEAQRAGGMRCFCFCRRNFAGCILSSRGQRRRQTNKSPV